MQTQRLANYRIVRLALALSALIVFATAFALPARAYDDEADLEFAQFELEDLEHELAELLQEVSAPGEVLGASTTEYNKGRRTIVSLTKKLEEYTKLLHSEQSEKKRIAYEKKITLLMADIATLQMAGGVTGNRGVDLKVNGSDGPVYLKNGGSVTVSWSTKGMKSCVLRLMSARRQGEVFTSLRDLASKGNWTFTLPNAFADHPALLRMVCSNGKDVRAADEVPLNQDWTKNWKKTTNAELSGEVLGVATTSPDLVIKASPEDPDATTIVVEDNAKSDWNTIFAFDLDADDARKNIEVGTTSVIVYTSDQGGTDDVIADMQLVVNGEVYDQFWKTKRSTTTDVYSFRTSGSEFVVNQGERVTIEVQAQFHPADGTALHYKDGTRVKAWINDRHIKAVNTKRIAGSATGEVHTLRTSGIIPVFISASDVKTYAADEVGEKDVVTYKITLDVTAFESDMYLDRSVMREDGVPGRVAGSGFMWDTTIDSSKKVTPVSSTVSAAQSEVQDTAHAFFIPEGETREFKLSVSLQAGEDGVAAIRLTALNWTADGTDTTPDNFYTTGLKDFKTNLASLVVI